MNCAALGGAELRGYGDREVQFRGGSGEDEGGEGGREGDKEEGLECGEGMHCVLAL